MVDFHIEILVKEIAPTREFFMRFFDFEMMREFVRDGEVRLVWLRRKNFKLELRMVRDATMPSTVSVESKSCGIRHLAFEVDNAADERQRLLDLGLEVLEARTGSSGFHFFFVETPEKVSIEIFERET